MDSLQKSNTEILSISFLCSIEIEEKINSARERKENGITEQVERLSAKVNDKMRRGAESFNEKQKEAVGKAKDVDDKLQLADNRRKNMIREHQLHLRKEASIKQANIALKRKKEEEAAKIMQKAIQTKLLNASRKKEVQMAKKVRKISDDWRKKERRILTAHLKSISENNSHMESLEKKMNQAASRKGKIAQEALKETKLKNEIKAAKKDYVSRKLEVDAMKSMNHLQTKLSNAAANRDHHLQSIVEKSVKSSTKKRMLSPKESPSSQREIEHRLELAASRRELFLLSRAEKASRSSPASSKSNRNLFAAVSPRTNVIDECGTRSPPNKVARVNKEPRITIEKNDGFQDQKHFIPIIAISGIAFCIVGLISYLKHQ